MLKNFWSILKSRFQKSTWSVYFCKSDWKNLAMNQGIKITNPVGHFLADPFVVSENGADYCFVEDYDFKTQKGSIAAYRLLDQTAEPLGLVLSEPYHLSFPFVFKVDSTYFMIPESAQNKDIRLYEAVDFPLQWKLKKTLMHNVTSADTMVFFHEGRWWMFANLNPSGFGGHCSELSIFYSDDLFTDTWIAHANNPVINDRGKARNGGLLFSEGMIYRVGQRQEINQYGRGFAVYQIECLTPEDYREVEVLKSDERVWTHHLHSNGKVTVFDCYKAQDSN